MLTVCSEGSWTVQSSAPEGNTAVLGYVSSQINYPGTQAWSSYHTITSSYAEQSPGGASADYEAAYDLWLNNYANEVMIWVDTDQQVPGGNLIASGVTIGGATYDVYLAAATATTGTISFDATANASTGTVDILDFFQWASSTDAGSWLPTDAVLTQFNFGWEICSTGGQTLTFTLDDVSVTAD